MQAWHFLFDNAADDIIMSLARIWSWKTNGLINPDICALPADASAEAHRRRI
jgi:hypothetical protein